MVVANVRPLWMVCSSIPIHEGGGVVEGFFDFEVEAFVDDAFYGALGESELTSNGFVVDVFAVFMGNHLPVLFAGSLFREESFHGFPARGGSSADICSVLL